MRLFSLDKRLSLCASFVRDGVKIADIGTDHAYLPIWLLQSGKIEKALACDINEGPLQCGKADVLRYNLSDKITLRLSDGLKNVCEHEADDIIIAGMGGELIAKILSECSWVKNKEKRFILQPMTKCDVLIKHYTVMVAKYTGNCTTPQRSFLYTGKLDTDDENAKVYLSHIVSHLEKRAIGDKSLTDVIENIKGRL